MEISKRNRLWLLGGAGAAVVVVLLGWLLVIKPQYSDTSDLKEQTTNAEMQTLTLQRQLSQLKADNVNLPKYQAALALAQQALPADSGVPEFLRSLQSVGAATAVTVTGISVGSPAPLTASKGSGSSGVGQVYSLILTVSASGQPEGINAFLKQLQQVQPRAVLLTSVTEAPGLGTSQVLTLNLNAFMAPSTATAAK